MNKHRPALRSVFLASALAALLSAPSVHAGNGNWNVDNSGNWSLNTNWNPAVVPGTTPGDIIGLNNNIGTATRTVTIDAASVTAGTLNIGDSDDTHSFTLARGSTHILIMNNGLGDAQINETGGVPDTISAPIQFDGGVTVNAAGLLTLSGGITETGIRSLTKTGNGTLSLAGASSYTGGSIVSAGALSFRTTASKAATGIHAFGGSATLGLGLGAGGFTMTDVNNALNGDVSGLANVTITGTTKVGVDTGAGNFDFNTALATSSRGFVKLGTNTLTLSTDNSAFTGDIFVDGGTLAPTHNLALGSTTGSTTVNGGNGTGANTLSLSNALTDLTIAENLNFAGNAAGRVQLFNGTALNHTLTGNIDVSSGTNLVQFSNSSTGSITVTGDITGTMTGGAVFMLRGTSTSATNRLIGNINLSGNLTKTDNGTWLVGAAGKTYNWSVTQVANGILRMGAVNVLPSTSALTMGNTTGGSTGVLDLNGFDQTVASIAYNGLGVATGTKTITSTTAAVLTVNNATDNPALGWGANNVVFTGNLGLNKTGAGKLVLPGTNTHSGATTVNGGILSLGNNLALQNSVLVTTGVGFVNLESGITTPTIGGLSGATGNLGTLISSGYGGVTALTLNPGAGVSVVYGGGIANGAAGMTLTKSGAGTQTLTAANSFTGNVTITGIATANTLRIEHSEALGPAATVKNVTLTGTNRQVSILELANNITVDINKAINTSGKSYIVPGETSFGSPVFLRNASGNNTWRGNILITAGGGAYSIESAAGTLTLGDPGTTSVLRNDVTASTRTIDFRGAGDVVVNAQLVTNGTGFTGLNKFGTGTLTLPRTDNQSGTSPPSFAAGTTVVQNMADSGSPSSIGSAPSFNFGGTFRHVGAADSSSNRAFGLLGAAATLESSGAGSLALTSPTAVNLVAGAGTTVAAFNSGATVLTGLNVHTLFPGMTIAGANIAGGTKITAVDYNTRQITLDTPTTGNQTTHLDVTISNTGDLDRTFTLGGTNTGANRIASPISNPSGTGSLALVKEGTGSWTLTGQNTHKGTTRILGGILDLGEALALQNSAFDTDGSLPGDGTNGLRSSVTTLTLGGLIGSNSFAGRFTSTTGGYTGLTGLTLNPGAGVTHTYSADVGDGATGMTLTKSGAGTQTLAAAQSYTGTTTLNQGTLAFTGFSPNLAGGLTFGTNASTLDLGGVASSATFAGALTVQTNSTTANLITLGAGKTLTINGGITMGNNTDAAETRLTVTGGGALVVNGTSIIVGNNTGGTNFSSEAHLNLAALDSFTTTLSGSLTVQAAGDNSGADPASLTLSNVANTITAAAVRVGNSSTGSPNTLWLGGGTNLIQTDLINLGAGSRDSGIMDFAGIGGSVTLRNVAGTGRVANVNLGRQSTEGSAYTTANVIDLTGNTADVAIGTFATSLGAKAAANTNDLRFDSGTLDIRSINMAFAKGAGSSVNKITIGGGTVRLGGSAAFSDAGTGTLTLATAGSGELLINGGDVTSTVSLRKGAGGTGTATLTLAGGVLDMGSNSIGSATDTVDLVAQSGTLGNVGAINGAGTLTKTTAGTLILSGANTYTGTTDVSEGTLLINGTTFPNGLISVSGTATLGGSTGAGQIGEVFMSGGTSLRPGNTEQTDNWMTVQDLTLDATTQLYFDLDAPASITDDVIEVLGSLTLAGELIVNPLVNFTPLSRVAGDKWLIAKYAGPALGSHSLTIASVPALSGGLSYEIDISTANEVYLAVVPEAGTAGLLALGLLLLRRR